MGSIFKFKQFEVDQNGCAMRINTDGVLLGAIADHPQPVNILDIGTGTGVIAMMLAQRFPLSAVDAVEIDESAAAAAQKNFIHSPFSTRTAVYPVSYEKFESTEKYDLIVSNPPFFVNDLKNPEKRKEIARHTHEDFFDHLLRKAVTMMHAGGRLWLILPVKQAQKVVTTAVLHQLYPSRIINICSDQNKLPFRQVIALGFEAGIRIVEEQVYIYEAENSYTEQYRLLLKDFFLAF